MNISIFGTLSKGLVIAAALVLANPANSAAYMKLGDIKGESTAAAAEQTQPTPATPRPQSQQLNNGKTAQPAGLILPAVQSVREAPAKRPAKTKPAQGDRSAGGEHEVEYDISSGV